VHSYFSNPEKGAWGKGEVQESKRVDVVWSLSLLHPGSRQSPLEIFSTREDPMPSRSKWLASVFLSVLPVLALSCGIGGSSGIPFPGKERKSDSTEADLSVYGMRKDCGRVVWRRGLGSLSNFEAAPSFTAGDETWPKPSVEFAVSTNLWTNGSTEAESSSTKPECQAIRAFFTPGMAQWESEVPTFLGLRRGDLVHFDPNFTFTFSDLLPSKLGDLSKDQLEGKSLVPIRKVEARFTPGLARSQSNGQTWIKQPEEGVSVEFECETPFRYRFEMRLRDVDETNTRAKNLCRQVDSSPGSVECLRVAVEPGDKCKFRARNAVFIKADNSRVRASIGGTLERSSKDAYLLQISNVELP